LSASGGFSGFRLCSFISSPCCPFPCPESTKGVGVLPLFRDFLQFADSRRVSETSQARYSRAWRARRWRRKTVHSFVLQLALFFVLALPIRSIEVSAKGGFLFSTFFLPPPSCTNPRPAWLQVPCPCLSAFRPTSLNLPLVGPHIFFFFLSSPGIAYFHPRRSVPLLTTLIIYIFILRCCFLLRSRFLFNLARCDYIYPPCPLRRD